MADVVTTTKTYAKGIRQTLQSVLDRLGQEDTPFLAHLGRPKIENRKEEWTGDRYRERKHNAVDEGAEGVATERKSPEHYYNYTQISTDTFKISGTAAAIGMVGAEKSKVVARETVKAGVELMRDVEYDVLRFRPKRSGKNLSTAAAGTEDNGTTRESGGVPNWVHSDNVSLKSSGATTKASSDFGTGKKSFVFQTIANATTSSATTQAAAETAAKALDAPSITTEAFTEARFKAGAQKIWAQGGKPGLCFVTPDNLNIIQGFTGSGDSRRIVNMGSPKIGENVNLILTPWGTTTVVPVVAMPGPEYDVAITATGSGTAWTGKAAYTVTAMGYCLITSPGLNSLGILRPSHTFKHGKSGDSDKRQILIEYTFKTKTTYENYLIGDLPK